MCLAFPGRVTAVDEAGAVVETEGRVRRAATLLHPEVTVGDWVLVAMGTVVERLEPEQAAEIRAALLRAVALDGAD
jgi:hydrogenase assembly chaperone HypC/HupF